MMRSQRLAGMLTRVPRVWGRFGAAGLAASPAAVCRTSTCREQGRAEVPKGCWSLLQCQVPVAEGGEPSPGALGMGFCRFPRAAGAWGPFWGGTAGTLLSPAPTTAFQCPGGPQRASHRAKTPDLNAVTAHGPCASPPGLRPPRGLQLDPPGRERGCVAAAPPAPALPAPLHRVSMKAGGPFPHPPPPPPPSPTGSCQSAASSSRKSREPPCEPGPAATAPAPAGTPLPGGAHPPPQHPTTTTAPHTHRPWRGSRLGGGEG